eukprot:TRINITY_DN17815_c0_g1_i1.p1 TRINITY_DN17815_c0_g1~~TRINITY_DN17815_c0_g1_i1.p1  ORF type:complete len:333 (+),score=46.33 TRINITY_DN17815_c0_g1_i1:66-1001(+)
MMSVVGILQSSAIVIVVFVSFLRMLAHYLKAKQAELLYYPNMPADSRRHCSTPREYGIEEYSILDVVTSDGVTLKAYYIPHGTTVKTLIHFHGNAGNIGHRIPQAQLMMKHLNTNIVLAEYRGYGLSDDGVVTEETLMLDAQAVLNHVLSLDYVNPNAVIVHGSSLGGAVGVQLAAQNSPKIAALILENTFTCISDMVDSILESILKNVPITTRRKTVLTSVFTNLIKPVVLMLQWRSVDVVAKLEIPVLFVSGTSDELVPPSHMRRLYGMCKSSEKKLALIEGGMHNDTFTKPNALKEMREYLDLHVRDW